jgi:hypothetical protein
MSGARAAARLFAGFKFFHYGFVVFGRLVFLLDGKGNENP